MNFFVDGLPVPEDYAMNMINSGRMGGVYDILGQVKRQSVPSEVNSGWTLQNEDAADRPNKIGLLRRQRFTVLVISEDDRS